MQRHILFLCYIFFITQSLSYATGAGPWYTGPLLAPSGHTIPRGHTNFEFYAIDNYTTGHFDENGNLTRTPLFRTSVANPIITHGFTDWMDVQVVVPYVWNSTLGRHYNRVADVSATIGLQVLEQKKHHWIPDLRFAVQEIFPTGRFEFLNPAAAGTDSTGLGAYGTQLALNFQHLTEFKNNHFLRTRLSLTRLYTGPVKVHGLNSFGGTENTIGTINTDEENDADLAFEFSITPHWVAVMEGYVSAGQATRFEGLIDASDLGGPPVTIASGAYFEEALAPAIEYNFNANIGLIAGVWFPIKSKNLPDYIAYMVALNAFW